MTVVIVYGKGRVAAWDCTEAEIQADLDKGWYSARGVPGINHWTLKDAKKIMVDGVTVWKDTK